MADKKLHKSYTKK